MSRRSSLLRALFGAMVFVAFLSMPEQQALGQGYCTSCTQPDQVWRVDICMAPGQTRTVDVTVCNEIFCSAQPLAGAPCVPNPINDRTVIKKICPVGWVGTIGDLQAVLNKVIPMIGPCCGGWTYLNACPTDPDFNWLVSYPTCWEYTGGCWVPCLNAPCCMYLFHYQFNVPSPGDCRFDWGPVCGTGPEECHPPTVPVTCLSVGCNLNPEPCCP